MTPIDDDIVLIFRQGAQNQGARSERIRITHIVQGMIDEYESRTPREYPHAIALATLKTVLDRINEAQP